jgi:hypothetical protein
VTSSFTFVPTFASTFLATTAFLASPFSPTFLSPPFPFLMMMLLRMLAMMLTMMLLALVPMMLAGMLLLVRMILVMAFTTAATSSTTLALALMLALMLVFPLPMFRLFLVLSEPLRAANCVLISAWSQHFA